jgi:integron integrase
MHKESPSVSATMVGDGVHVRFGSGFTAADLEIVRAISGRRWHREDRTWWLPNSPSVLASLRRGFAERLVIDGEPGTAAGSSPAPADTLTADTLTVDAPAGTWMTGAAAAEVAMSVTRGAAAGAGPSANADGLTLVAELRRVVRLREYSPKTEKAYASWVQRYLRWAMHGGRAAAARFDERCMVAFLEQLSHEGLAARSRNQAASALHFLLREVLQHDGVALPRARGPVRMPLVLTHGEVMRLLRELSGKYQVVGMLLYSSGLRIGECLSLRIKDIDFELRQILIRDGKGRKDRYVPLAARAVDRVQAQARLALDRHRTDLAARHGWAPLPGALHRKDPGAGFQPGWQFLFPASTINVDPASGRSGRWSLHVTAAERAFKAAVRHSGIAKRATCHTLRHSFATETLRAGCDIRTLQQIMGHRDIRTTMIYLHVVQQTGLHIRSPLDRPDDYDDVGLEILPALFPDKHVDEQGGGHRAVRAQPEPRKQAGGTTAGSRGRRE